MIEKINLKVNYLVTYQMSEQIVFLVFNEVLIEMH